jgi:hypothetical protein
MALTRNAPPMAKRILPDAAHTDATRCGSSIQEPEIKKALDSLRIPGAKSFIVFFF